MKIKWLSKLRDYLRRYFTPNVRVRVITPKEEVKSQLVSFHGDTYSIYNHNKKGEKEEKAEIKLQFHRHGLKNYMDIIVGS